ncbi:hypothetical protein ACFR97_16870 [Haloplanus litoreus]
MLHETRHPHNIRWLRMSSNDTKHVQTELNEEEYARFREFAEEHGLSLKEASHEALIEWVERQQQADPNDAAFTVLDDLDDSSLPRTAQTDAREEDDLVDEWHGNDESFVLAEDPSSNT